MKSLPQNSNNFFALFEQPVQFEIDQAALDARLRELQKQYHPDNTSSDNTSKTNQNHDSTSALINHAYQTLKSADSRASYLLEMVGQDAELNNSIADLDFLDDAMELRIDIDEADAPEQLVGLQQAVASRIDKFAQQFEQFYNDKNWNQAIDITQKLKFLVKLKKDVAKKIDALHQQDDAGDDDLYL
ncbi:Fe-S protein assembly co-chaperone HscB [Psychrobacter sp. I-STPA10]|uniref:Fe-S protein assembly co-chaperone HscB n=1 Tax=Psychrobacter sp. I-STPA10 TaxID=2585769 RepID=UPI001E5D596B|nr:Fe-S protein assembly co-chaperone HscB [Psychrobacter sp. I-STPA10]